jgi:hypothetical protein
MTAEDFITELFCRVDDQLGHLEQHPQGQLHPSEIVTLGMMYALKGRGQRAFYRWMVANHQALFPGLPSRSRLFRALNVYRVYAEDFLAAPSMLGVIDSFGIEFCHPRREGRSPEQLGKKGKSNWRWIVGGKLCFVLNHLGQIVDWECDTANVYDGSAFQHLVDKFKDQMVIFSDSGFEKVDWFPTNLRTCQRGEWNVRMVVETVLSMLTRICDFKRMSHRAWTYFESHLCYTMTLFNLLIEMRGLQPNDNGFLPLSTVDFDIL